ncbi:hypothetical protein Mgra_00001840 [Meloidogyne graminicola]|uniref:Homeobox domain-containing protein n=1 Tax=Meloidogyne graminicola TaxID=189291 RepID=A0A8T0A0C0_9BILA|nr:hypothetical protein Mgra_00001840 [Meloidogyne graminicola]
MDFNNNNDLNLSIQSSPSIEKEENIFEKLINELTIYCGLCNWNENGKEIINLALEHSNIHSEYLIDQTNNNNSEKEEIITNKLNEKINKTEKDLNKKEEEKKEEENFFCWKSFDKYLINAELAKYLNNNEDNNLIITTTTTTNSLVKCSFCSDEFDLIKLPKHITKEHNIPLNISQNLTQQIIKENKINSTNKLLEESIIYSPSTSLMANNNQIIQSINSEQIKEVEEKIYFEQLRAHSLSHSSSRFRLKRKNGNNLQFNSKQKIFCDICQETFETNDLLTEHFNSEKHLQKISEEMDEGTRSRLNSYSQFSTTSTSKHSKPSNKQFLNSRRNSNTNKYLPYICNICTLSFGQPGTLDTHLRSTAHAQRIVKLDELIKSRELNPQLPIFEQPEPHPPQKSIEDFLLEKKMQQKMGKLTTIQAAQQQTIPSTSTTKNSSEQNLFEFWKNSSSDQSNNLMINFMTQLFNNDTQQKNDDEEIDNFCTSQMSQIAQMMLNAQMTAAAASQFNSLNSEDGKIGLLDLFGIKNEEETNIKESEELNKSLYEEPQAKKPKTERKSKSHEKSENKKINQNTLINENSDQNGCFSQNNSTFGDLNNFASVLKALTSSSSSGFVDQLTTTDSIDPLSSQFSSNFSQNQLDDQTAFLMATMAAAVAQNNNNNGENQINQQTTTNSGTQSPSTQQKRARTRIGDDHYFDINNSPSEEQIKEMAKRTNLAEKVIKHWFRNTLFKERQRDKDSPYNFSIPPQMSIDLATYHKTGEAKIVPLIKQEEKEDNEDLDENEINNEKNNEGNSKLIENNEIKDYSEDEQENNGEDEEIDEENNQKEEKKLNNKKSFLIDNLENELINNNKQHYSSQLKSIETVAADLLANIGKQQINEEEKINNSFEGNQQIIPLLDENSFTNCFDTAGQFAQMMFSSAAAAVAAGIPPSFSSFADIINPFISSAIQQINSSSIPSCSSSINQRKEQQQQQPNNNNIVTTTNTNTNNGSGSTSGRRANRTRFTDFQLRTMQEFFDKQAYPKDDDLEMLSKKLGLSPRVIVVWFQNARQKARKVFEQQPHLLAHHSSIIEQVTEGRYSRTPSTNFQCKVCGQIFQRYLELIQHQQKICCFSSSSSSSVKIEEQNNNNNENIGEFNISDFLNGKLTTKIEQKQEEENLINCEDGEKKLLEQISPDENNSNEMILFKQLLAAAGCSQLNQIKLETSNDNDIINNQNNSVSSIGQCPFCSLQFICNEKLIKHISDDHLSISSLNSNNFEENNNKQNNSSSILDLTINNKIEEQENEERENNNYSIGEGELKEEYFISNDPSLSPNFNEEILSVESSSSLAATLLLPSLFGGQKTIIDVNQRQLNNNCGGNNSKRFRTHLTPMQVMKSLFHDYKTPSMQECDSLGKKIGLTKRVVQVWFQNTRAKERKNGNNNGESEELIPFCGSLFHCQICDLPIGNNLNNNNNNQQQQLLQEHIFNEKHIEKVKERCTQLKTTMKNEKREEGYEEEEQEEEKNNENNLIDWNNDELILEEENLQNNNNNQSTSSSLSPEQSLAAQLPYYALAAAAAAGGIGNIPINGLPLLYDPLLFGTPVSVLKVPESVSQQIINDMTSGKGESHFTQDGLEINELENKLGENFKILSCVDLEVGWGCSNCNNVFQQPELLQNHWKLICPNGEDIGPFRLIQTHYQCNPCQKNLEHRMISVLILQ